MMMHKHVPILIKNGLIFFADLLFDADDPHVDVEERIISFYRNLKYTQVDASIPGFKDDLRNCNLFKEQISLGIFFLNGGSGHVWIDYVFIFFFLLLLLLLLLLLFSFVFLFLQRISLLSTLCC